MMPRSKDNKRLSTAEKLAEINDQAKALKARLRDEKRAQELALGIAVAALLASDAAVRACLLPRLRASVTKKRHRTELAELLALEPLPAVAHAPQPTDAIHLAAE